MYGGALFSPASRTKFRILTTALAVLAIASIALLSHAHGTASLAPTARTVRAQGVQATATGISPLTPPSANTGIDHTLVLEAPAIEPMPQTSGEQHLTIPGPGRLPETLDPALLQDAESSFIARQIFRGLVGLDDSLAVIPMLAQRIEVSADGLTYTFTLRDNAVFHDGTAIDAVAVKRSFERATDPALANGDGMSLSAAIYLIDIIGVRERLLGTADGISGIQAVDAKTVVMQLSRPVANFLYKITGSVAEIVDTPSVDGDDWWMSPNGSGPFRIADTSDDALELASFDRYFGGEPPLTTITMLLGSASSEPLNLYEGGSVDLTEVPLYGVDRVLSASDPLNAELITVEQLSTTFVLLNPNLKPFDDPEIRQAVLLGFERTKVASVMLDGKARVADGLVPPGILGRDWPAEIPEYDPEAARAIIDRVGIPEVQPAFFDAGIAVALKLVLERELGLDSEAISLEWPDFSARLNDQSMPAFSLSWIADYPDPANFLTSMFSSSSPDNYIGYHNDEMDALLNAAEVEADNETRESLYLAAQQLAIDDAVLIPLYHDVSYMLVKPYVRGVVVSPTGIMSLERVWIER